MRALATDGASELEVRVEMGITEHAWYRLLDEDEEFAGTVKECRQLCQVWWERHGRRMANGADGNATVWIFNMKNRFNWRDKSEHDIGGKDGEPIKSITEIRLVGVKPDGNPTT